MLLVLVRGPSRTKHVVGSLNCVALLCPHAAGSEAVVAGSSFKGPLVLAPCFYKGI